MRGMVRFAAKKVPGPVRRVIRKETLAPLLVLTLLVCHGAFGAMHQVVPAGTGPAPAAGGHSSPAAHGDGGGEQNLVLELFFPSFLMGHAVDDGEAGVLSHAAALLFTVAAVLWSLLKSMQRWREAPPPRPPFRRPHPKATLRCPPGPTVPALQVFRL